MGQQCRLSKLVLTSALALGLTSVSAFFSPAHAKVSYARLCNETGRTLKFVRTEASVEFIREAVSLWESSNGYRTRTVLHRKADGWYEIAPGRCITTGTGTLADPAWHAFINEDGRPLMFTPSSHVVYENRPDSICYSRQREVLDRHREHLTMFGMDLGDRFYVEQTDNCEAPDYQDFPVSFGIVAVGNVDYTITLY